MAIYRANERNGIPQKYLAEFEGFLDGSDHLRLVVEKDGNVVGIGGITYEPSAPQPRAGLVFGLISPVHQRSGLGKALLVARLSALEEPKEPLILTMTNVGGSLRYYKQFGFSFIAKLPSVRDDWFVHSAARLNKETWQRCRALAEVLHLDLGALRVPTADLPPAQQPGATTAAATK
jgi:predicted N-acetyltransferase YhbS